MEANKQQYPMLDLAKFLCALLILFYHYFSEIGTLPALLEEALSSYAIAVALFMTISGYLTFRKIDSIADRNSRWQIVWRQAWRILRIYLLWSVVYILYSIGRWDPAEVSLPFVLRQLRNWIFGSTFYTIWFMPSLALGLMVAFWITELLPQWAALALAGILYITGSLTLTYSPVGGMIPGFSVVAEFAGVWLGGSRGSLLYGFPMIIVGRCMAKRGMSTKKNAWLGWMSLLFLSVLLMLAEALTLRRMFGHTGIDMTMLMPVSAFCILGFLLSVQIPQGKYLIWMRKMSVLIFLSQRIF